MKQYNSSIGRDTSCRHYRCMVSIPISMGYAGQGFPSLQSLWLLCCPFWPSPCSHLAAICGRRGSRPPSWWAVCWQASGSPQNRMQPCSGTANLPADGAVVSGLLSAESRADRQISSPSVMGGCSRCGLTIISYADSQALWRQRQDRRALCAAGAHCPAASSAHPLSAVLGRHLCRHPRVQASDPQRSR